MIDWSVVLSVLVALAVYRGSVLLMTFVDTLIKIVKNANKQTKEVKNAIP